MKPWKSRALEFWALFFGFLLFVGIMAAIVLLLVWLMGLWALVPIFGGIFGYITWTFYADERRRMAR
jgi:hypothetical protein